MEVKTDDFGTKSSIVLASSLGHVTDNGWHIGTWSGIECRAQLSITSSQHQTNKTQSNWKPRHCFCFWVCDCVEVMRWNDWWVWVYIERKCKWVLIKDSVLSCLVLGFGWLAGAGIILYRLSFTFLNRTCTCACALHVIFHIWSSTLQDWSILNYYLFENIVSSLGREATM